jgi:hypothetical protein
MPESADDWLIRLKSMLKSGGDDWLVRLRSLGDVDRRALITIALYNVMDDLVRCIDDAVKSDIPRVLLMACLDTIWLGLKKTVSERV